MTTITYKDGILAGDSQMSRGDEKCMGILKVGKTENFLLGFSGSFSNAPALYSWFLENENIGVENPVNLCQVWENVPNFGSGFSLMIVNRAGLIWTASHEGPPVFIPSKYDAAGSGSEFAIGAMAAGASAPEAVRIAAKYDVYTGGPVSHVKF